MNKGDHHTYTPLNEQVKPKRRYAIVWSSLLIKQHIIPLIFGGYNSAAPIRRVVDHGLYAVSSGR